MKTRYFLLFGTVCLVISLLLSAPILTPYLKGVVKASDAAPVEDTSEPIVNEEPRISGNPIHIDFPKQGISVDVAPGYYDASSKSWTLSEDKAHYATVTPEPNNKTGNTFIYGHNLPEVFSRLVDAQPGDIATVGTANGRVFTYTLTTVRDVEPTDTSAIQDHKSPILTVQTCSGLWYENRRMFTFELSEVR